MIPYGRQDIQDEDLQAVMEVLRSDYLTQGPVVPRFEQAVSEKVGAGHAVAVNSGTSALHLACMALGLGVGDWLWTSPITYVASANCALYCGARVDFVDIDPGTLNLCPEQLERKLQQAEQHGRLPKVVVPVHMCGQPCDMAPIRELSRRYGFSVVEDASHAIGASYKGVPVGACQYSDITVFSFHPVKIITTGEGGLALTNSQELAEKMSLLRSHGVTRDPAAMTHEPDGPWYYQQIALGFNYRITELQAALGLSQLQRLDGYVARRHEIAERYDTELSGLPLDRPRQHPDAYSAFHLYVVRLKLDSIGGTRREVFHDLRERGVGVHVHYIPVHTQPYYRSMGFSPGDFPESERYYNEALTLPIFPGLQAQDQARVVHELERVIAS